jgi:lipopolysaccharide/colanic/teichoic acid biosynthesis glycosyltransferase
LEAFQSPVLEARQARQRGTSSDAPLRVGRPARSAPLSENAFRTLVNSERACLELHAHSFSLVTFEAAVVPGAPEEDMAGFARRAASLLRSTDVIGLTGSRQATVLLPFAHRERAQEVAELLLLEGAGPRSGISYTVEAHGSPAPRRRTVGTRSRAKNRREAALPAGVRWEERGMAVLLGVELPKWKRALDILLALLGLLVLAPVMILIAAVIRVLYGGPVIYAQWRTGKGYRRFRIHKFRTMRPDKNPGWEDVQHLNEMSGPLFKSSRDPRVLKFGKLLRKTSLDELPQLVDVLAGHMTLVGPRALSPQPWGYETWQLRRFDVTPGVACEWQAERRSDTEFEEWMRSDLRYVDRGSSFAGDMWLLVRTLIAVLRCAGSR